MPDCPHPSFPASDLLLTVKRRSLSPGCLLSRLATKTPLHPTESLNLISEARGLDLVADPFFFNTSQHRERQTQ